MSSSRTIILRQGRRGIGIHFQTGPKVPFQQDKCEIVLKEVIDSALEEYQYSAKLAPTFSAQLADEIVKRIKELGLDRFKLVCTVTIGERFLQGLQSVVKFLWEADKDGFASYTFDTPQFFCSAILFAIYLD